MPVYQARRRRCTSMSHFGVKSTPRRLPSCLPDEIVCHKRQRERTEWWLKVTFSWLNTCFPDRKTFSTQIMHSKVLAPHSSGKFEVTKEYDRFITRTCIIFGPAFNLIRLLEWSGVHCTEGSLPQTQTPTLPLSFWQSRFIRDQWAGTTLFTYYCTPKIDCLPLFTWQQTTSHGRSRFYFIPSQ